MDDQKYSNKQGANWTRENSRLEVRDRAKIVLKEIKIKIKSMSLIEIRVSDQLTIYRKKTYKSELPELYLKMESFNHLDKWDWELAMIAMRAQVLNARSCKKIFSTEEVESIKRYIHKNYIYKKQKPKTDGEDK